MKHLLTVLSIFCTLFLSAQTSNESFILLKGHIANNTDTVLEYGVVGYLSTEICTIHLDKKGGFRERIKVRTEPQYVFFRLTDGLQLSFEKDDTVEMSWNAKDPQNTLTIKSPSPGREKELQIQFAVEKKYFPLYIDLVQSLYKGHLSDSVKATRINDLCNKEIKAVLAAGVYSHTENWIIDIYFRYASQMRSGKLLPGYDLTMTELPSNSTMIPFLMQGGLLPHMRTYQIESESAYLHSASYRDFLFDYIRFFNPMNGTTVEGGGTAYQEKTLPFTPAWNDYYAGLRSFHVKVIRDWFISKCIIDGFGFYSYDEVNAVYKDFLTKEPTPYYAQALKEVYDKIQGLKPGAPAPQFSLKDENGRDVSLSDYRGKVVFIDFWGVHCSPCIYDIKNHVPTLHEKYKDKNIVFINICVDGTAEEWKENLQQLHLSGINLYTQASISDPVCKAYNINGIPHYFLIDPFGRIIDNNSPSPSMGDALSEELNRSLKQP